MFGQSASNGPPQIETQPISQLAPAFGSATLTARAEGAAPLNYQWFFEGEPIPYATNASLILGPLGYGQSGYYNVIVSNALGQMSSVKAKVSVAQAVMSTNVSPYLYTNQTRLLQFTNLIDVACAATYSTVAGVTSEGNLVESGFLSTPAIGPVAAVATPVALLEPNGTAVELMESAPPTVSLAVSNIAAIAGPYPPFLFLTGNAMLEWSSAPNTVLAGESNIVGIAANQEGLALRADGTVVGLQGEASPQGVSNAIAVSLGDVASAMALLANGTVVGWSGTGPPEIQFGGASNIVAIAQSESCGMALTADGHVLTQGSPPQFPFAVSNVFKMAVDSVGSWSVVLLGNGAPFATVQAGNQFVNPGATVWLHARAVGVQPMTVQWQLNGLDIAGATNGDLTLTNIDSAEYGAYQAIIGNRIGTTATRVATVSQPVPFPPTPPTPSAYTLAEALGDSNLVWLSSGNALWFTETNITHDSVAAGESGGIGNSEQSVLQTTVNGPGVLTFWWMVSSEEDFDFLQFWVGSTNMAEISGETAWEQETFSIGAGKNQLKWIYSKDPDVSVGLDAGWLDQVSFTPTEQVTLGIPKIEPGGILTFSVSPAGKTSVPLSSESAIYFEASSDLIEWTPLTNSLILSNGAVSVSDPDATNRAARFYRLNRQ